MNTKLVLGTVQMGLAYGVNNPGGKIPEEESFKILETAYNSGIKELDTAEAYGNAHQIIGKFHDQHPDLLFDIFTKITNEATAKNIRSRLLKFMEDLQVERLKGVSFHSFSSFKSDSELKLALARLKVEGLFNYLGVSVYTNDELEEVIENDLIDLIQVPYNLLDNKSMKGDLLDLAKKKGKIVHTRSAFLQGLFFKNPMEDHPVVSRLRKPLYKIQSLSEELEISIAALAMQYCLRQPFIDRVIIGVDSVSQLQENIDMTGVDLSQNAMDMIDNIKIENKKLLNPSLWP